MGKGQRSKRNRYNREIIRNSEVAEEVYSGKIKYKKEHYNKYAGEEFKGKKKKNKNPATIDNKLEKISRETEEKVEMIVKDYNDNINKITKRYNYGILIGLAVFIIVLIIISFKII